MKVALLVEEDQLSPQAPPPVEAPPPTEVPPAPEVMPPPEDENEGRESKRILEDKRVQSFLEVFQVQEKPKVRKLK